MKTFVEFADEFEEESYLYCGPCHIIFDDGNTETSHIVYCLRLCAALLYSTQESKHNYAVLSALSNKQVQDIIFAQASYLLDLLELSEDERWALYTQESE